jgi:hypothetical protein
MMTTTPTYVRQEVLDTAGDLISGDRDVIYGDATESFTRIATIWSALLNHPVTPAQVGMMLAGMKLSRLSTAPDHRDSWVDLAGYAALGAEVESKTPKAEAVDLAALWAVPPGAKYDSFAAFMADQDAKQKEPLIP